MGMVFLLSLIFAQFSYASQCSMNWEEIPTYEKKILKILDEKPKDLNSIQGPLKCLTQLAQKGVPLARLAARNTFYALIGGESLPGASDAEMRRFQRSALLLQALGNKDPKQADFVNEMLGGLLKGEWQSYKLFCEQGDISHCLVFLPKENEVEGQDDLVAAAGMLKWQIAHSKLDLTQRAELEKRIKNLYEKRGQYSTLKKWFIEKIYFEMLPKELPMGMA